jgi:hypothetical protein
MNTEYLDAPVHILDSINRYVEHGFEPGSFLTAVLSNDLAGAFNAADSDAEAGLRDIVKYIHWEIPSLCWGSRAKVEAWLEEEYEKKELTHGGIGTSGPALGGGGN